MTIASSQSAVSSELCDGRGVVSACRRTPEFPTRSTGQGAARRDSSLSQARQPENAADNVIRELSDELPDKIEIEPDLRPQQGKNEQRNDDEHHAVGL